MPLFQESSNFLFFAGNLFRYYLAYGTNDEGAPYIYPQLNWATPLPTGCLVVAFYAVALPTAMLATWSLWFCGRALGKFVEGARATRYGGDSLGTLSA